MCKILVIAGLNPKLREENWSFIQEMATKMSTYNDHGLGYAAVDDKGNLFGERWLKNDEAFDVRTMPSKIVMPYSDFLESVEEKYSKIGKVVADITAITLHARMATSGKEFFNTHPFYDEASSTSLIHNGVIHNVMREDNIRSTCDSERILNKYLAFDVNKNPEDIQKAIDALTGYFACGVISKDKDDKRIVDVFKNTTARLSAAFIKELGTMVFTTDLDDVRAVCRALKFKVVSTFTVKPNTLMRLDAITGKPMMTVKFTHSDNVVSYEHRNYNRGHTHSHGGTTTYLPKKEESTTSSTLDESTKTPTLIEVSKDDDNVINDIINKFSRESHTAEQNGWEFNDDGTYSKNKRLKQ